MLNLINNRIVQLVLVFILGASIGAIFYPTSHIETKLHSKYELEEKSMKETYEKEQSQLKETLDKTINTYKSYKSESSSKINSLTVQVHNLESKHKTSYYKLIKPDGTIEIRKATESDTKESDSVTTQIQQEFKTKIQSIEDKWEKIHKDRVQVIKKEFAQKEESYKHQIQELDKSKVVDVNKKVSSLEVGYNTDNQYYLDITHDLFGPIFMGIQIESDKQVSNKSIGAGLGLRF